MDTYHEDEEEVLPSRVREDVPLFAFPLEPFDLPNARFQVASRIGKLPFDEDEECSRSLWLVFTGCWGVWTRAVVPIDSRIDAGDPATVAAKCDAIADLLAPPDCYGYAIAAVVLRRPGPSKPTRADRQILRRIVKAAAARHAVSWSFCVTGFDGFSPLGPPSGGAT